MISSASPHSEALRINLSDLQAQHLPEQKESTRRNPSKLTVFQTSLALVASNISVGMLAMPYAVSRIGALPGLVLLLCTALTSHFSSIMYLKVKDLTPQRNESLYEFAFLLLGRPSIVIVCVAMFLIVFFNIIIFYTQLASGLSSLATEMLIENASGNSIEDIESEVQKLPLWQQAFTDQRAAVIFIGLTQFAVIFKRQLVDLTQLSYFFLAIVLLFVCLGITQLMIDWKTQPDVVASLDASFSDVQVDKKLFTAFSIMILS